MKFLMKAALIGSIAATGAALYAAPGDAPELEQHVGKQPFGDMLAHARMVREQSLTDTQHVMHLQAIARKQKDIIKLNCVNDKLVQIKPQLNVLERSMFELEGALISEARQGAYEKITTVGENVRRLKEEADQCAGEPILSSESTNTWTHPNIPEPYGNPFTPVVEPPGYASPFN